MKVQKQGSIKPKVTVFGFMAFAALLLSVMVAWAQKGDLTHQHAGVLAASVDFGVLPTGPIGPPPCLQDGAIGGPADPCSYLLHHLTPEEVTVSKEGEVTFQIHGGGHGLAIYEVSKNTTRDQIGQFLCSGDDPGTIPNPTLHPCNLSATNANRAHIVSDGHGDVVIVASPNVTNAHPGQPCVVRTGEADVCRRYPVFEWRYHSRRPHLQRPTRDLPVSQDGPLPGDLHESHTLPE